jgi:hypothetical protein
MGEWSIDHVFLTTLVRSALSASRYGRFTPGERAAGAHWIRGWVGTRTGLDDVEKRTISPLPGLELDPSALQHIASRYTNWAIPAAHRRYGRLNGRSPCERTNLHLVPKSRKGGAIPPLPHMSSWHAVRPRVGIQVPAGIRDLFFSTASRPVLGPPASYRVGTGGSFRGGKAAGAWSWPLTYN